MLQKGKPTTENARSNTDSFDGSSGYSSSRNKTEKLQK
jgi:hypothetical protein